MEQINQYELGKMLYHDWKQQKSEESYNIIRGIGKENVNIAQLKFGFIKERTKFVQDDNEDEECFYGAMDEVGIDYWTE